MMLLDTNALIWLAHGHRRARPLAKGQLRLHVSPATLLEVQLLIEGGRIRLTRGSLDALAEDPRWTVDAPSSEVWFRRAWDLSWTRDPFDRLIVAHARLRRWRLATGDDALLERLGTAECLPL